MANLIAKLKLISGGSHHNAAATTSLTFTAYNCTCTVDPNVVHLTFKHPDTFKCIIKNYLMYLQSRNMEQYMSIKYMEKLKRYVIYDQLDVHNLALSKTTDFHDNNELLKGNTFMLYLKSPYYASSELLKHMDLLNCTEFINFIKLHIYCDGYDEDINHAKIMYEQIKKHTFNF